MVEIDILIFERSPKTLDKNIVIGSPSTIHTNPNLCFRENLGESNGCKLTSLIGIENGRFILSQCLS